ncbi:MAG: thioredoxin-like domain-containing protein [Syntrophaceae bacterium]|nr:thioredoxin-like domain-containing protein [Syntrophaceae bacterium]
MSLNHRIPICLLITCFYMFFCHTASAQTLHDILSSSNFNLFRSSPPANSLELDSLNNNIVNPARMQGKVIILNFWKIDCSACVMEKPILERLQRKYSDRGLQVVSVNLFDRPSDIKDYLKKNDYPFIFAFDSLQRYTVNQKRLPSGVPTTFVVNSDLEAIYEIPGLPTTYVIDRYGRVTGYSIGLVNWDENSLTKYIESLLGPETKLASVSEGLFSGNARQGANFTTGPTKSGPRKNENAESSSLVAPTTQIIPSVSEVPSVAPTLPFQSTDQVGSTNVSSGKASPNKSNYSDQDYITVTTQKPPKQKRSSSNKKEKSPSTRTTTHSNTPKPFVPSSAQKNTGSFEKSQQPGDIPGGKMGVSSTSVGGTMSRESSLPPLPAAMPYSPPRGAGELASTQTKPDNSGFVTSRMPGSQVTSTVGRSADPLPAAQPVGPPNSIGISIMDSFGNSARVTSSNNTSEFQSPDLTPPATVFGQLSRDIQNLGAGIRDTFSSLIPKTQ